MLQVILYSFPAVCWIYGAGTIFSLFVSVVFWGPLLQHLYESLRKHTTIVRPMGLEVSPGSPDPAGLPMGSHSCFATICSEIEAASENFHNVWDKHTGLAGCSFPHLSNLSRMSVFAAAYDRCGSSQLTVLFCLSHLVLLADLCARSCLRLFRVVPVDRPPCDLEA